MLFRANDASDCLHFLKFRRNFENLVAPSTDGTAKRLMRYKAHLVPTDVENSVQIHA